MKRFKLALLALLVVGQVGLLQALEITPLQVFYIVRQGFPEQTEVSVLITEADYHRQEKKIGRAAAQMQLKVTIHVVRNSLDVGKAVKRTPNKSILVVFDNPALTSSKTKLYVLSKCKDKKVSIVTTSQAYSESGALLGVYNEKENVKIVLNLKKNSHLKAMFSEEVKTKLGVSEVLL